MSESCDETIDRVARAAHDAVRAPAPPDWVGSQRDEYWVPIARAVLAAAPPTPAAPGVAALLAECAHKQQHAVFPEWAVMYCDEIVRLLAPEGADKEGEGT